MSDIDELEPPPDDSVVGTIPRRPNSVRRTANINMVWPEGPGTGLQLRGRARDLLTQDDGTPVVLDEATSSLDPGTEQAVEAALERLTENRTVVVVAHRLSTAARADRVAVVDDGQLIELGTHEELVQQAGRYAGLYASWTAGQALGRSA